MRFYSCDGLCLLFLILGYACFMFRKTKYCTGKAWLYIMLFLSAAYLAAILLITKYDDGLFYISALKPMSYIYLTDLALFSAPMIMYFSNLCGEHMRFKWLFFILPAAELIMLAANEKLHLVFWFDEKGSFFFGSMMWLFFAVYIIYFVLIAVMLHIHHRRLGRKTCASMLLLLSFEIILQIIQSRLKDCMLYGISISVFLVFTMTMVYMVDNHYDDMTGLLNRKGFYYAADELMHLNRNRRYLIVRLDVINFQDVNERFGHDSGNVILRQIAEFLKPRMGIKSALGYMGADDYVACIPEDEFQVYAMRSPITSLDPYIRENYDLLYSVGIYKVQDIDMDISLMCDRAEYALQSMQKNCREHIMYFNDEIDKKFTVEKYIVHEMYHALAQDRFEVYIQPIVDTQTQKIVSGEALARWNDARYGMISPAVFIPVFERNGFVSELDRYVLNRVCMFISARMASGRTVVPVSVNLSRVDLKILSLADTVNDIVNGYGIPPELIKLEVTESAFERDNEQFTMNINRIHSLGYKILMDDFGSGYSNFNTFSRMPVDILKADMGFMSELEHSDRGSLIMKNILNMTHELSIPVIVEGVETDIQYDFLRRMQCEQIQGYYFSRPVPMAKFSTLLESQIE